MNRENAIEVIQSQIDKLQDKEFELNAWKNFTVLLLERIFGRNNKKIEAIEKIKYDQGSWVLRDETGYANSMEACKNLGKEVLTEAIMELEKFGPPEPTGHIVPFEVISKALQDELTGSQLREIKELLSENRKKEELKKVLVTKLKAFGSDAAFAIVAGILSDIRVSDKLQG